MKKLLHNFQWNPPSKKQKRADQTLQTSTREILFWVLKVRSHTCVLNANVNGYLAIRSVIRYSWTIENKS